MSGGREVQQYEIDTWLGEFREEMTASEYAEFSAWARAHPEGDWTTAHQAVTGLKEEGDDDA
jgi:hypothetical protein